VCPFQPDKDDDLDSDESKEEEEALSPKYKVNTTPPKTNLLPKTTIMPILSRTNLGFMILITYHLFLIKWVTTIHPKPTPSFGKLSDSLSGTHHFGWPKEHQSLIWMI
jgi:hypothetical protein